MQLKTRFLAALAPRGAVSYVVAIRRMSCAVGLSTISSMSCLADSPKRYEDIAAKLPSLYMIDEQIKLNPKDATLYVQRAAVQQFRKNYTAAIADFTKAIEMKYTSPEDSSDKGQIIYGMRAICYMQMKNFDAAISDSTKAMAIAPSDAVIVANRGAAYLEKKQYVLAMNDYTRALQLDPKLPAAYEGIGETCYKTGQYARAIEYLTRAVSGDTKVADAYYYRGAAYKAMGNKSEADKDFQRASALGFKPGQPSIYAAK